MRCDARTLVLNRNWVPVGVTTVRRAIHKVYLGVARAVRVDDYSTHDFLSWARQTNVSSYGVIRSPLLILPVPEVIMLTHYTGMAQVRLAFSRQAVLRRDHCTCQYCGARPGHAQLTIDHVTPRSLGGASDWTNCVACCRSCNTRKGNRTPQEAGITLRRRPVAPPGAFQAHLVCYTPQPGWVAFLPWTPKEENDGPESPTGHATA